jgi:PmbA protein
MSVSLDTALQAVELARRAGAVDADAWWSTERTLSVTIRDGEVENLLESETQVLGLRAFLGDQMGMVCSSDLRAAALADLASQAVELAKLADHDAYVGLSDGPLPNDDGDSLEL